MLEMNAGHADEAQRRFEKSIAEDEDPSALLQLGLLLERTGQLELAEQRYRRALELTPRDSLPDELRRSEILEHMGDVARAKGETQEMTARYQEALKAWTEARDQV
jgi:tetratricopeptide (TPR) repeat protein